MSSSKYIPQVGDTVRLINSGENWCDDSAAKLTMTQIQENTPLVIVTKVSKDETNEKEDHYNWWIRTIWKIFKKLFIKIQTIISN